LILLRKIL